MVCSVYQLKLEQYLIDNFKFKDSDGVDFVILSLHNKQWHFEASSVEERDEWVAAIEQQILSSLQVEFSIS